MGSAVIATIVLALALVAFGREIPARPAPRIIGGSNSPIENHPHTVSLRVYFVHFCGGSILTDRWVLTAAHCIVKKEAHQISVIAGTHLLSEAGQMYQAILKISHPNHDGKKFVNDIGLILVSRTIVFTEKIQPIPLPTQDFDKVDYPAIFSGWGTKEIDGPFSQRLQEIDLKVISQAVCASREDKLTSSHICTLTQVGEGACHGDPGGPLIADDVQIGVHSFAKSCAIGHPDVFTRVWTFVEWINLTIKDNKPPV